MYRISAAVMAVATCAASVPAQNNVPVSTEAVFTLDQALAAAGLSSPAADAAQAAMSAAQSQRTVAGLRPNPSIDTMTENVAGTGPYGGFRSSETTAGISLPLELGGKRLARVAVAGGELGRAAVAVAIAHADLRLRVSQTYNEAVASQRRAVVAQKQVAIAADVSRAAHVRVSAGRASPLEEQRAAVARISAEGAAERAVRSADAAGLNLARLIGRPVTALDEHWFNTIAATPRPPIDVGDTLTAAAAQADLTTATAQVRLARSQRTPNVTVGAAARRLEATNDKAGVFSLSVPLPLFSNGRAAVDVANAQRRQADANRRMVLLDAEQMIATAQAEVANAATTARNSTGSSLAAAQEAARIARIGYREGKFGQLDLLEAERTLLEVQTGGIDALAAYHDAHARLERLTATAPQDMKDAR